MNLAEATMLTARSMLCPVDLSEQSRLALLWAAAIAQHRGAVLTVLSVTEPLLVQAAEIGLGVDLTQTEAEPALRAFVEATLPEGPRHASHLRMEATVGEPSEAILRTADRLAAGLIVMGTRGRGGFHKLLLGSTTEQVLRRTKWPVLAVPAGAEGTPGPTGSQQRKILLATDFRQRAMAATQWAADLASDIGVPLVLAHVVEPVVVRTPWQALMADFDSDRVASGQRMLARLSASLPDTRTEGVVSVGAPADTIASLAAEYGAGLVVMGLADPDDPEPRKPGSIAYRVLQMAHVAVAVVPRFTPPVASDRSVIGPGLSLPEAPRGKYQHIDRLALSQRDGQPGL
jgi:nucleotide-binding universal stress UspA family protein